MSAKINALVVDDDLETLDVIKLYLSETANVTAASSGRQALLYAHQQLDVIILDIEMPVMNGFQTLEQLRNLKECINVPVIMLTGKRDKYSVMNSISMGIDGYLLKPVNKEELLGKIAEVCQNHPSLAHRKTILAIDDDMSFLKLINSQLKDDYNVIMINSTKLALDYLIDHVPDLILLDYQMPLYNGVAVISIIQQNANCQNIPVIILSGTLDQKAILDFYPHSPAAYLAKPVSKEALIEKIEQALSENNQKGR
jgi:CheY-like chemotaxis protein